MEAKQAEYQQKSATINVQLQELEQKMQDPEVLRSAQTYQRLSKDYAHLKQVADVLTKLVQLTENYAQAKEMLQSEDAELAQLAKAEIAELEGEIETAEGNYIELTAAHDPLDNGNAIVEIRAGTGGEEAAIFAQELYRAYSKYAESLGFRLELANLSYSSAGAFKEVIFFVEGAGAYKQFKYESGVHRVQRVPSTESSGRIHTSAASVVVLPESPEIEVAIKDEDLRIDVYRAGGPGGQSVNTTDSAVRIVHVPTGIIVTCQDEKSQLKNKAKAMKILQAKLYDLEKEKFDQQVGAIRQSAIKSGDRSAKIRTYNFPQSRVTDHRIKESWHNLGEILEGNFSDIIAALAKYEREQLLAQQA
jgi:peptide chain release factor 1